MWVRSGSDRRVWTVNRRWLPWRPRLASKRAADTAADGSLLAEAFGETILGALIAFMAVLVLVVLVVLLIAEWFIVLALAPLLVLVRLSGLFTWIVVARQWDGLAVQAAYYGEAKGWPAAWRMVRAVKREIRETGTPESLSPTPHP